jgi:hypothetical protein
MYQFLNFDSETDQITRSSPQIRGRRNALGSAVAKQQSVTLTKGESMFIFPAKLGYTNEIRQLTKKHQG